MRNGLVAAAAVLALSACDEVLGLDGRVEVRTARAEYSAPAPGGELAVPFTVHNGTVFRVQVMGCGASVAYALQRRQSFEWGTVNAELCPLPLALIPVVLEPGESVGGTARVPAAGEYRVRIHHGDPGESLDWAAYSNEFTVR